MAALMVVGASAGGCLPVGKGRSPESPPGRARVAGLVSAGVRTSNAVAKAGGDAVAIAFSGTNGYIDALPAGLGLPLDWRSYGQVSVILENHGPPSTVEIAVRGARGAIAERRELGSGHAATIVLPLDDLPLAASAEAPFTVEALRIASSSPSAGTRTVLVREILLDRSPLAPLRPRVDAFGQRLSTAWTGKVRDGAELRRAALDERRTLDALTPLSDRDEYGGWTAGPRWQETGFFTVERDGDGRFWMVDPAGQAFWSLGVNGVRTRGDATPVRGREFLFAHLPPPGSREAREVLLPEEGLGVAFYRWNVLRKWGEVAGWRDRTLDRLQRWGLNTIAGASADAEMLVQRRVPQVETLRTTGLDVPRTPSGLPDVFDPRFAAGLDRLLAEATGGKTNPWLVGYLVDANLPLARPRLLDAPSGTHLRARWSTLLRERHGSLAALARAWGVSPRTWDALRESRQDGLPPGAAADIAAFEALYAETYLEAVAATLRKHDPNHLYLGPRFSQPPPGAELLKIVGKHVDVVTIADWGAIPDRALYDRWHEGTGKPLLVGAHGIALRGPRQVASRADSVAEQERRAYYIRFVTAAAALPYVVGAHWREYVDQPLTGRALDGGNQIVGLVDITDRPHQELTEAVREVAARIYETHAAAR